MSANPMTRLSDTLELRAKLAGTSSGPRHTTSRSYVSGAYYTPPSNPAVMPSAQDTSFRSWSRSALSPRHVAGSPAPVVGGAELRTSSGAPPPSAAAGRSHHNDTAIAKIEDRLSALEKARSQQDARLAEAEARLAGALDQLDRRLVEEGQQRARMESKLEDTSGYLSTHRQTLSKYREECGPSAPPLPIIRILRSSVPRQHRRSIWCYTSRVQSCPCERVWLRVTP